MSIHIAAQEGQIAEVVLFPGDLFRGYFWGPFLPWN